MLYPPEYLVREREAEMERIAERGRLLRIIGHQSLAERLRHYGEALFQPAPKQPKADKN